MMRVQQQAGHYCGRCCAVLGQGTTGGTRHDDDDDDDDEFVLKIVAMIRQ